MCAAVVVYCCGGDVELELLRVLMLLLLLLFVVAVAAAKQQPTSDTTIVRDMSTRSITTLLNQAADIATKRNKGAFRPNRAVRNIKNA